MSRVRMNHSRSGPSCQEGHLAHQAGEVLREGGPDPTARLFSVHSDPRSITATVFSYTLQHMIVSASVARIGTPSLVAKCVYIVAIQPCRVKSHSSKPSLTTTHPLKETPDSFNTVETTSRLWVSAKCWDRVEIY